MLRPPSLETACLSDAKLALEAFIDAVPTVTSRTAPAVLQIDRNLPSVPNNPLTALEAFAALSELRPQDAILVNETASNFADLIHNSGRYRRLIRITPLRAAGSVGARPRRWALRLQKRRWEQATLSWR